MKSDHFWLNVSLKDQPATHCSTLSTVASLYDPLGFVAPVLLKGKIILQEMCRRGKGWDDPLPDVLCPKWEQWRSDLAQLHNVSISPTYSPAAFGKVTKTELHNFSDASLKGYGQCSYLILQNKVGDIVLMKEEDVHRHEWRLGRFSETTADKDGLVRRVEVHLDHKKLGEKGERLHKMSEVERPVQKLVPLLETDSICSLPFGS